MKTTYIFALLCFMSVTMSAQSVLGKWLTKDVNGNERFIIEIYKENELVFGKVVEILDASQKDALCKKCTGINKDKPILGLQIIKNLHFDGTYFRGGNIIKPKSGKSFKCRLSLEDDNPDVMEVRRYVAFMHESVYWKRYK